MSSSLITNSNYLIDLNSGANTLSITGTVAITGNLSVSGNSTLSGNILGDRIQNGTTSIDIQTVNGNANITVGGTSNVAVFATTGAYVAGLVSVTGNITGTNLSAVNLVINRIRSDDSSFVTIDDGVNVNGEILATGNITGNYFIGNGSQLTGIIANTGNVTFSGEIVIGTGTSNLISGLYLAPSSSSANANMYLRVRGNIVDEPTHIHFDTGNNAYYNQFIGDDNKYILLANTGNIVINANNNLGNSAQWTFGTDGNLSAPGNISAINLVINSIRSDDSSFVTIDDGVNVNGEILATGNITGGNISTAGVVKTGSFVTGTIPTASGVGAGARAFVTDADSVTFGNLYTGSSGNAMPVWSNGTSWYVG